MLFKKLILLAVLLPIQSKLCFCQSPWPAEAWDDAVNLTSAIDTYGLTELSGLHWNPVKNRLYVSHGNGKLQVLELNPADSTFRLIAFSKALNGSEGITQADYLANEFYTIDEEDYLIRKYTHSPDFALVIPDKSWSLLVHPSPMSYTGNEGPEGIVFIPDLNLKNSGFISEVSGEPYLSTKGAGGLFFIAHQRHGMIWVYDINPNKSDDFEFVGKYKSNRPESCGLAFDRTTGLLYILHNTGVNYLETTDLKTEKQETGDLKFVVKNEYLLSNPQGYNINIEGFAISSKCDSPDKVSAWLCRDVHKLESEVYKKDCLRWFRNFNAEGDCDFTAISIHKNDLNEQIKIVPNPASRTITIVLTENLHPNKHFKIFDLEGRLIKEMYNRDGHSVSIDIGDLMNGLYIFEAGSFRKKFLKTGLD